MQITLVHGLLSALLAVSLLSTRAYARRLPPPEVLSFKGEQEMVIPQSAIAIAAPTAITTATATAAETDVEYTMANSTSSREIKKESTNLVAREATEGAPAVKHIRRAKREFFVDTPFDFHTTHLFCDIDVRGRHHIIWFYPNHCIWVWNNKYVHEGFYRLYKMYQLEAFFFGQWNVRLFQFEFEKPSFFEY
ncbi:uncharacterized protein [Drosophila pseudoobscura]|uniref:Uncharacterized protein n=1 Tax=Drosophila pseudoobscura pseudoobscura TaxID=46245 RepID=A0A6I8VG49_DROPS|nr:uncharacterized protein LOC117183171 [Drosophila pseudoobscura]